MATCVACGAELEPPVRAPHTVYVKTLYRIGGQDYCRHHIIRGGRGRRHHHRDQTRRRTGGRRAEGERIPLGMTNLTSIDLAYAITLRQFWASLVLGHR